MHPDLSGTYDITALTPATRPARYGTQKSLSDDEAKAQAKTMAAKLAEQKQGLRSDRQAPAKGGARPAGATGDPAAYEAAAGIRASFVDSPRMVWRGEINQPPVSRRFHQIYSDVNATFLSVKEWPDCS
jgi:hypothetical protein